MRRANGLIFRIKLHLRRFAPVAEDRRLQPVPCAPRPGRLGVIALEPAGERAQVDGVVRHDREERGGDSPAVFHA